MTTTIITGAWFPVLLCLVDVITLSVGQTPPPVCLYCMHYLIVPPGFENITEVYRAGAWIGDVVLPGCAYGTLTRQRIELFNDNTGQVIAGIHSAANGNKSEMLVWDLKKFPAMNRSLIGEYRCRFPEIPFTTSNQVSLMLIEPINIQAPRYTTAYIGQPTQVTCSGEGYPLHNSRWLLNTKFNNSVRDVGVTVRHTSYQKAYTSVNTTLQFTPLNESLGKQAELICDVRLQFLSCTSKFRRSNVSAGVQECLIANQNMSQRVVVTFKHTTTAAPIASTTATPIATTTSNMASSRVTSSGPQSSTSSILQTASEGSLAASFSSTSPVPAIVGAVAGLIVLTAAIVTLYKLHQHIKKRAGKYATSGSSIDPASLAPPAATFLVLEARNE